MPFTPINNDIYITFEDIENRSRKNEMKKLKDIFLKTK